MVRADRIPPTLLVLAAVSSVQLGGAFAKTLFDEIGPGGTAFLRVVFAAVILAVLWRPAVRGLSRAEWQLALAYGFALVAMNLSFYEALDRIPLGIAVTFEFVGPLGVAIAGSRRPLDLVWVVLAAAGIVLLSDFGTADLDGLGVALALLAGGFWAAYILLAARVGRTFEGAHGLAIGMCAGAVMLLPFGVAEAGSDLLSTEAVAVGLAVAVLSSVIPYTLELEALRRMPQGVFGVLMSLEPAAAALAAMVLLAEFLTPLQWTAVGCVVVASVGATRSAEPTPEPAPN